MLSNRTKELMHQVMNDNIAVTPILHQLSHYRHRDAILMWLIISKITGGDLISWLKEIHNNSVMSMVKFIIKYKNKAQEEAPIVLGKDWIK